MPTILYEVLRELKVKEQIVREKLGEEFSGSAVAAVVIVEGNVDPRDRRRLYKAIRGMERKNPPGLFKTGSCAENLQLTRKRPIAVFKNVAHCIGHKAARRVAEDISNSGNLEPDLFIGDRTSIYKKRDNPQERIPVVVLYSSRSGVEDQLEGSLVAAIQEVAGIINR